MEKHSAFRDGLAAIWHEPALAAVELTWRWCFGFAAWMLVVASAAWFLDSLKISPAEQFILSLSQPWLWRSAMQHIFRGSLERFVLQQAFLLWGLTLLWSVAATAGRAATLLRLAAMFREEDDPGEPTWQFAQIFCLQLVRAIWTLFALAVLLGSLVTGTAALANERTFAGLAFLIFGASSAIFFGSLLNWFFGLAPIFCVGYAAEPGEALEQAADFTTRHSGQLFVLGLIFLLLRLVWAGFMFFLVTAMLGAVRTVPVGWWLLMVAAAALIYFAGADVLYLWRLAAYVSLAEDDAHPDLRLEWPPEPGPSFVRENTPTINPA